MKKLSFSLITATVLLLFTAGIVFGDSFTLGAENGKILAPAGFGLELNGAFQTGQNPSPLLDAEVSYGITPAITVTGVFKGDFKNGYQGQKLIEASLSPTRKGQGYTVYTDYNLDESNISRYGISLWKDTKFLYVFGNLESRNTNPSQVAGLALTPGINMKLGQKLSLGGEVEYDPAEWSSRELRVGANYRLNRKMAAKFTYQTGLRDQPDRTFWTGVTMEF
jgi:hypothetical protein